MKRYSPSTSSSMAVDHSAPKPLFLYCEEEEGDERAEFEEEEESKSEITFTSSLKQNKFINHSSSSPVPPPPPLLIISEYDEQIQSLLSKERGVVNSLRSTRFPSNIVLIARKKGVEMVLRSSSFHGFSASAAILAVDFLDRFLFDYLSAAADDDDEEKLDKPWLVHLVAVASLSLAAKFEETHVPLLLDFQEEDGEYLFEAKTIKRMELLILSTLKWRMNPVTPISFIHHITRRVVGLKSDAIQLEFLRSCENTILSLISDSRIVGHYPSVLATATMLYVVHHHQVEYLGIDAVDYEKTMFQVLKINQKEVEECYAVISEVNSSKKKISTSSSKRKIWESSSGSSICSASEVIVDDEAVDTANHSSSSSPLLHPLFKKSRA